MRPFTLLLWGGLLAANAFPQVAEIGGFGGVSRQTNNQIGQLPGATTVSDVTLKDGFRFGFRLTLNSGRITGHEFGYAYNRTQFNVGGADYGTAIHQGFYNFLLYFTPEGTRIRPFVTPGVHFNNYIYPGLTLSSGGGSNKFGFNYGGGLKVRVSDRWIIRADFRQYANGKPFSFPNASGLIRQTEISAGFALGL